MSITDLPTKAPARKVVAGAIGTTAGVVLADLVSWTISALFLGGADLAQPPQAALDYFTPLVLALLAGYFTPRGAEEVGPPMRWTELGEHDARRP